ncbi:MAG: cysteine--tRNA ligase [Candidatus Shikimatogenerans bostrichidophilus]|nr:MAG: cysteine--tRNA ligase [Candidatus Shikimatogenerans bostrichidophilus]
MKEIISNVKKKIFIYNSLTKKKELFIPINKNNVNMYICGPTIYKNIHLGNCRTFIFFDIIYRYFKHLNFNIKYIRNLTDIKNNFNKKKNYNYFNYIYNTKKYYLKYNKILKIFNLLSPTLEPLISNYIPEQINSIKKIINLNYAYIKNGSVYFNINRYNKYYNNNYGNILNSLKIYKNKTFKFKNKSEKIKKNDFVLWKKNLNTTIKWESQWSLGIPGWHIGCSTLINKFFNNQLDIHGGGIDLKFPHHESEIVLSKLINFNNKNITKFWIHTNMLTIDNKKMSKSLNNLILPYDIIKGKFKITNNIFINPYIIKLYILLTHYRKTLNFSYKNLNNTIKIYFKLLNIFNLIKKIKPKSFTSNTIKIKRLYYLCYNSLNDDFNIPILIDNLFKINNILNLCLINKLQISLLDLKFIKKIIKIFIIDILGLKIKHKFNNNIKYLINKLLIIRNKMREKKLYIYSDKIRDLLKNYIIITDNKLL